MATVDEREEDRQLAHILLVLIWASWATYLIVIITCLYTKDGRLLAVTLAGCGLLTLPFALLRRGHLRSSSFVCVLIVIGTVTTMASVGQGIRDVAVVAYPIVLIFAGMVLNRNLYRVSVGATLLAVCWLALGEIKGWFVPRPFVGGITTWILLIGVATLILVAALAVDLLATNLRNSLNRARQELVRRTEIQEQLRYESTHDVLTTIYNRLFFEEEQARLERSREFPISIIIADVDGLKAVNDTLGHAVGDELLRRTAQLLRGVYRQGDVVARIGGDEFAVLLPATDGLTAEKIVLRVKARLAEENLKHPEMPLRLSLGASTSEAGSLADSLKLADRRMYETKAAHKTDNSPLPGS